jgi:hypothetical protein
MVDWLVALYHVFGSKYPLLSLVGATLIGAFIFGGAWWLIGNEAKNRSLKAEPPPDNEALISGTWLLRLHNEPPGIASAKMKIEQYGIDRRVVGIGRE